jgi:hypothetical protein
VASRAKPDSLVRLELHDTQTSATTGPAAISAGGEVCVSEPAH